MTDKETFDRDPISNSICKNCCYLAHRTIIPFNEADYGINRSELNIPDDQDIIYEHYLCKEIGIDLDHIVLKCNFFKSQGMCLLNVDNMA